MRVIFFGNVMLVKVGFTLTHLFLMKLNGIDVIIWQSKMLSEWNNNSVKRMKKMIQKCWNQFIFYSTILWSTES